MKVVEIQKDDYSYVIKKSDVWIVYTKTGKYWVCEINGIANNDDMIVLKLATKGKSGRRD